MSKVLKNPILSYQNSRRKLLLKICKDSAKKVDIILPKKVDSGIIKAEYKLSKLVGDTGNRIRKFILWSVEEVIKDTLDHYNALHKKEAGVELSAKTMEDMRRQLIKRFVYEPFKGGTFDSRIERIIKKARINVGNALVFVNDTNRNELVDEIESYFYSVDYIPGGSMKGGGDTLLVSEENRFYHETAVAFFEKVGIQYVKFCLSPTHQIDDECNNIATYIDTTLEDKFKNLGIDVEGVYRVGDLPEYPHPRASYYLEPIYLYSEFYQKFWEVKENGR